MDKQSSNNIPWHIKPFFSYQIPNYRAVESLNNSNGVPVEFQSLSRNKIEFEISGGQSNSISIWLTQSRTGFITVPKFDADLFTIRFVTSGKMLRSNRSGEHLGLSGYAMFVLFDDMQNEEASSNFSAISGTITRVALIASHQQLEGNSNLALPDFLPIVPVDNLPMQAFQRSFEQIYKRIRIEMPESSLFFALLEEIITYQFLSCWPRKSILHQPRHMLTSSKKLGKALDYIEANLSEIVRLSDIAKELDINVRTLQYTFKNNLNMTPLQYIIERRMQMVHEDISANAGNGKTVSEIARRWGFLHLSDFSQRYRKRFGCTPTETLKG